jgi:hypothetical protein
MINQKDEIAFELTEASTICGNITVYSTSTGLFAKRPEDKPSTGEIDLGIIDKETELQWAEAQIDYRHIQNAYLQSHQALVDCYAAANLLRVTRYVLNNRFIRIINEKAIETIYYIKDNNVYLPDCRDKHKIVIVENEPNFQSREHCADYIPVRIQINELVEPNDDYDILYLTHEKILIDGVDRELDTCLNKYHNTILVENNTKEMTYFAAGVPPKPSSPDPDTEPIYRIGYYTRITMARNKPKQLQEIDYLQPNLIKTQKIENKAGNKLAAEGKEDKVIWTDAEDASEKSWKQKLSSIATNTVQIIRETFWTVKIIIGTAVVTLIITSLTIGIIILNKVKISRTQPRRVNMITASAPCCDTDIEMKPTRYRDDRDEAIAKTLRNWQRQN